MIRPKLKGVSVRAWPTVKFLSQIFCSFELREREKKGKG